MKKILFISALLCIVAVFVIGASFADEVSQAVDQLKAKLQESGISQEDIKAVEPPAKEMIKQGADIDDIKYTVVSLSKDGLKGGDLKDSVNSMKDLVKDGENAREAGNVVSQAAHTAKAQGLKGKDLAAKVHEAVRTRKVQKEQAKQQAKQQKQEMKSQKQEMKQQKMGMQGGMGGTGKGKCKGK